MPERPSKILVVEDEPIVLHTLQLILKQHGYEVRGARDGLEAIAVASDFEPDILLCDINLPDANGIQISLAVKTSLPDCRIVLLSGEVGSTELLEHAENQGYRFEVLAKPAEPQHLLRVLANDENAPRKSDGIHRVK